MRRAVSCAFDAFFPPHISPTTISLNVSLICDVTASSRFERWSWSGMAAFSSMRLQIQFKSQNGMIIYDLFLSKMFSILAFFWCVHSLWWPGRTFYLHHFSDKNNTAPSVRWLWKIEPRSILDWRVYLFILPLFFACLIFVISFFFLLCFGSVKFHSRCVLPVCVRNIHR